MSQSIKDDLFSNPVKKGFMKQVHNSTSLLSNVSHANLKNVIKMQQSNQALKARNHMQASMGSFLK